MTVQRVLRQTQAQPEVTFYVGTVPTDADAAVTVTITRADGTVFAADAATTHIGTNSGLYSYTLAPQTVLELFTFDWKGTFGGVVQHITTQVEIVGGYIVSLADLKAQSGMGTKTDAQLAEARQWFEDAAEAYCGVAFVPRFAREVLDGDGTFELDLLHPFPRTVLSCKVDGVTQTGTASWDLYEQGLIARDAGSFAFGRRNVEITYEHGLDRVPSDIRDAALTAMRSNVIGGVSGGGIPAGVTQLATDAGIMTFGRRTFPFGIPEVDAVLGAHRLIPIG